LTQVLTDFAIHLPRAHRLFGVPLLQNAGDDAFDEVEVRLRLQRVVDAVIAGLVEFDVVHPGVVAEVRLAGRFYQPVSHKRAGRDEGFDDAGVDQVGDDQSLFGHGHRPRERHHHEAVFVAGHGFEHVGADTDLPRTEGRVAHRGDQVVDGLDFRKIEGLQRDEFVGNRIVQFAVDARALMMFIVHKSSE